MLWTTIPLQARYLGGPGNSLDLRADFQDFWLLEESSRLGRSLRQAFENLVERHRLYEIIKVEERPRAVRLTLAHMWRFTRLEGHPGLILHTFDLAQGRWREQDPAAITWRRPEQGVRRPNIAETIWPALESSYGPGRAGPGLFKNIMAAWLEKVRPALRGEVKPGLAPVEEEGLAHLFFRWSVNLPADYRSGVIDSVLNGYIWNREAWTSLFPLRRPDNIRLSQVLEAQSEDLVRIKRESPKAWKLLNFIPSTWWPRRDLLQDRVLRAASPLFANFSPAGLRWLRRAPAETLHYFRLCLEKVEKGWAGLEQPMVASVVAELMAALPPRATEQPELAEAVMVSFLRLLNDIFEWGYDWASLQLLYDRLLRLQARHIVALWDSSENPEEELAGIKEEVRDEGKYILDWLNVVGHQRGLPDKNSTWRSLKRRSDKWHEGFRRPEVRDNLREAREALAGNENAAWESLLGETVIDGLKVTPLVTGMALYNESLEMRHCVITYAPHCVNEGWRIFSLEEAGGARSTLSLKPESNGLAIDQHKGPDNRPVSPAAARAAREVCRLYNQKCREAAETGVKGAAA